MERNFYNLIIKQDTDLRDIQIELYRVMKSFDTKEERRLTLIEAYFMMSYSYSKYNKNEVFIFDKDSSVIPKFDTKYNSELYKSTLKNIEDGRVMYNVKLSKVISKINLIDDFNTG